MRLQMKAQKVYYLPQEEIQIKVRLKFPRLRLWMSVSLVLPEKNDTITRYEIGRINGVKGSASYLELTQLLVERATVWLNKSVEPPWVKMNRLIKVSK